MMVYLLVMTFILGTIVGSLLNVCIYRIPLEKSTMWPGSRCGHCFQRIRWFDNIPLLSYLILRGRCRTCGHSFSMRYFLIELLTGACFSAVFYLVAVFNIHQFEALRFQRFHIERLLLPSWEALAIWGHHCLLISFLIVASFCDLDHREIPFSITIPGTALGLLFAVTFPWPWPQLTPTPGQALDWWLAGDANLGPRTGLYPWPFWGPLPGWFDPGGNWQTGLATGLLGALAGTVLLRIIRFLFSLGLGIEAMGLGDADLMMMAGSFLGWQPVVVAFLIGVFAGLIFGVAQMVVYRDNMMPFGPALAVGIVLTCLGWHWIGPSVQPLFFNGYLMLILGGASAVLMLVSSYVLRLIRM